MFIPTRRQAALIAVSALAVGAPAQAQQGAPTPLRTGTAGLLTDTVNVLARGGQMPVYVARPDAEGRFPVIIVVSEVFGLHPYIRDVCRRLARFGYVAVAPDFFFRAGDPSKTNDAAKIRTIGTSATNAQVMGDLDALLAWIAIQDYTERRIGITGFSWGGAATWMAMERFPQLRAGVVWYGRLTPPGRGEFLGDEQRPWPTDIVSRIRRPVLGLYAGKDPGISAESIAAMRQALFTHKKRGSDIIVYPNAEHGFHADYRPSYNVQAANDGWARMLDHFARNGVAPKAYRPRFGQF